MLQFLDRLRAPRGLPRGIEVTHPYRDPQMKKAHLTLFVFFCAALASLLASGESGILTASTERLQQRIAELSKFGANPEGGVSRVAFSDADIAGREYIKKLMQEAGLVVRVDTAGNIIGRRDGSDPKAARDHDRARTSTPCRAAATTTATSA